MQKATAMVLQQTLSVPVIGEYDIAVCGGGPAGIGAALSAARLGARVALVEHYGFLGGMWTAGLVTPFFDAANKGGIVAELVDGLRHRGAFGGLFGIAFDFEEMKRLLDIKCLQAGVKLYLHTSVVDVVRDSSGVTGVFTESKGGRGAILARRIIDCTGDGDVAARAGCTYEMGRPSDGLVQPMTLMFRLSGVRFRQTGAHQLHEMIQQALATHGGYDINFTQPWVIDLPGYEDQCVVQLTHVRGRSPIDAEDLTMAELEGRRLVWAAFEFLKKCVAEFKTARLVATAPQIGVRESRRITGQRCLTVDDVVNGRKSPEGITRCRFGIDIHQPDGLGQTNIRIKGPYDIPYGCLVPQGVENLLVAGRCICGDHEAMASYRVTGDCVAMGQAAGTAAVLSIADDVPLRLLDVTQLRDSLREQGCAVEGGES